MLSVELNLKGCLLLIDSYLYSIGKKQVSEEIHHVILHVMIIHPSICLSM